MSELKENPKVQRHMDICTGLNTLYAQKNHDYGDSFHDTFVEEGMAMARIRLSDKLNRFKRLTKLNESAGIAGIAVPQVKDESIRDTLLDLANYAIMTVMEMDIQDEEAKEEIHKTMKDAWEARLPENFINCSKFVCPKCGNKLTFNPQINKYLCGGCGTMYSIESNGTLLQPVEETAVDKDEDPCKKCTYPGKETCGGCVDRYEWEKQRKEGQAV